MSVEQPKTAADLGLKEGQQEMMVACCADFPQCKLTSCGTYIAVPASKCACHIAREAYRPYLPQVKIKDLGQ